MNLAEAKALLAKAADDFRSELVAAESQETLEQLRREFLGKKSPATQVNEAIKNFDATERPEAGKAVSDYKTALTELLATRAQEISGRSSGLETEFLDLTLGTHGYQRGHYHLITQVQRELEDVFIGLGYVIEEGPEVETDWYNFEALNFPPAHPARAMQDTMYVELGATEQVMLRTHTSPVQVRVMERQEPPIFCVILGRTYRNETLDARHSPVFHQLEGLAVDRGITFGDLAGTIEAFTSAYFRRPVKARLQPSFFPFTEPSAEVAVSCPFCESGCRVCSSTGWIELGGCGMVDPNIFEAINRKLGKTQIDPEIYTGFAFGFGLERMAMVRYGVEPIKTFFDNDVRFLRQY